MKFLDFDGLNLSFGASASDTCQFKVIKTGHLRQGLSEIMEGCL